MINKLVVHCSDSPHGRGDNAETIHKWHTSKGWDGIGYHYVILEDGHIEAGRPEYWSGAHVKDHNTGSIGICLIGEKYFTEKQLVSLDYILHSLLEDYPGAEVLGHRDLDKNKTCPNFDVKQWFTAT